MIGKIRFAAATVASFICLSGTPSVARDFSIADDQPGGWNFQVTSYAWLTGISGTLEARGRIINSSASFIDLVKNSDELIPFMGYFEASRDRFTLFGDVFYSKIGFPNSNDIQKNPIAGLTITRSSKTGVTSTLAIAQLAAAYDVARLANASFGVYGGARYWYTDTDITWKITRTVNLANLGLERRGDYAVADSKGTSWVDPIVGIRVRQDIAPGQQISFLGDIGGFGVGSQFSWQAYAGYAREFMIGNTKMAANVGYRALSVDYKSGSGDTKRKYNVVLHGPLAGLSLRW